MKSQKIRIVSDGTGVGTHVFDAGGREIKGCILKVEWVIEGRDAGQAKVTFANVDVDLVCKTEMSNG